MHLIKAYTKLEFGDDCQGNLEMVIDEALNIIIAKLERDEIPIEDFDNDNKYYTYLFNEHLGRFICNAHIFDGTSWSKHDIKNPVTRRYAERYNLPPGSIL